MKRVRMRKLIGKLKESMKHAAPHSLTFKETPGMSKKNKEALQRSLDYSFGLWKQTWVDPVIDELEIELNRGTSHEAEPEIFT